MQAALIDQGALALLVSLLRKWPTGSVVSIARPGPVVHVKLAPAGEVAATTEYGPKMYVPPAGAKDHEA